MDEALKARFEAQSGWSCAETYDRDMLTAAKIDGDLAAFLSVIGSGELEAPSGVRYHVLDLAGIEYWSREVLERLQSLSQPAELRTFLTDEGGGVYAFSCASGVYGLHHAAGLVTRHDTIGAFFEHMFESLEEGRDPFSEPGDAKALGRSLSQTEGADPVASFDDRFAARPDSDFRVYDPHVPWKKGDLMIHPTKGRGVVTAVKTTMYVQVEFASGKATLAHKGW